MKIKIIPISWCAALVFAGLLSSCTEDNDSNFTDTPIVEAYLNAGDVFSIQISRQIPFITEGIEYSEDDINNLVITVDQNDTIRTLTPQGNGLYNSSSIIVTEGDRYTITFTYNNKSVSAYTYVPTKPSNVVQSVTSISMDKMDSTSGPPSGSMPDPVQISWDNSDESYYLIIIENIESDPEPIMDFDDEEDRPERIFRKSPTNASYEEINPMEFEYFGTYKITICHVLPDYAALYEQNSTSSQNLSNPSTSISNGYGIFTGINSEVIYLEVVEN